MIRVDHAIDVDRPADAVFERLVRIEDLPRWQPAILEAELTSPGPMAVGSTARIVVGAAGQRTEAVGKVIAFERPRLIALEAKASSADITARVEVTPVSAASCRVSIGTTVALGGMLRFVEGIARSRIESEVPVAAAAAKAWLESDP